MILVVLKYDCQLLDVYGFGMSLIHSPGCIRYYGIVRVRYHAR